MSLEDKIINPMAPAELPGQRSEPLPKSGKKRRKSGGNAGAALGKPKKDDLDDEVGGDSTAVLTLGASDEARRHSPEDCHQDRTGGTHRRSGQGRACGSSRQGACKACSRARGAHRHGDQDRTCGSGRQSAPAGARKARCRACSRTLRREGRGDRGAGAHGASEGRRASGCRQGAGIPGGQPCQARTRTAAGTQA